MSEPPAITSDRFCLTCGYNLRGLTLDDRCPECGEPTVRSVRFTVRLPFPKGTAQVAERRELVEAFQVAADAAECPIDTVAFVFLAERYGRLANPSADLSARAICAAVRDYAKYTFGGEEGAVLQLAERGIRSSDDVGRIIYAMVAAKVFRESAGDSPEDFCGLFTLDNLFNAKL